MNFAEKYAREQVAIAERHNPKISQQTLDKIYNDSLNKYRDMRSVNSDLLFESLSNVPSSAYNLAKGLGTAAIHPLDTVKGLLNTIQGEIYNVSPKLTAKKERQFGNESVRQALEAANSFNQNISDRYGSLPGLLNTVASDPIGLLGDISTLSKLKSMQAANKVDKLDTKLANRQLEYEVAVLKKSPFGKPVSRLEKYDKAFEVDRKAIAVEDAQDALAKAQKNQQFWSNIADTSNVLSNPTRSEVISDIPMRGLLANQVNIQESDPNAQKYINDAISKYVLPKIQEKPTEFVEPPSAKADKWAQQHVAEIARREPFLTHEQFTNLYNNSVNQYDQAMNQPAQKPEFGDSMTKGILKPGVLLPKLPSMKSSNRPIVKELLDYYEKQGLIESPSGYNLNVEAVPKNQHIRREHFSDVLKHAPSNLIPSLEANIQKDLNAINDFIHNPAEMSANAGKAMLGLLSKLPIAKDIISSNINTGLLQESNVKADEILRNIENAYGNRQKIYNTMINDPFRAISDVASVLQPELALHNIPLAEARGLLSQSATQHEDFLKRIGVRDYTDYEEFKNLPLEELLAMDPNKLNNLNRYYTTTNQNDMSAGNYGSAKKISGSR